MRNSSPPSTRIGIPSSRDRARYARVRVVAGREPAPLPKSEACGGKRLTRDRSDGLLLRTGSARATWTNPVGPRSVGVASSRPCSTFRRVVPDHHRNRDRGGVPPRYLPRRPDRSHHLRHGHVAPIEVDNPRSTHHRSRSGVRDLVAGCNRQPLPDTVEPCSSHASLNPCPRPRTRFPAARAPCR